MSSSNHGPNPTDPTRARVPVDDDAGRKGKRRRSRGPLGFVLAYTRALITDQQLRRTTMFYVVIAAMLMAFCGDIFFGDWLDYRHHLARFAVYWLVCGWLTVLAALLAVYDLLLLRLQHRILRRELHARMLAEEALKRPQDPHEE